MEENKSILHELYVYCEWKPEPEYVQKSDGVQENLLELWRWLRYFGAKKSLIDSISAFKEHHLKWHIALGDLGKVIAVLTDNILEIRTKRSDFSTISARTTVPRDGYAQCRKLVWSPDCAFLVVAHGNGVVSFFDLAGTNLYNIPMNCTKPGGLECTDNTHSLAEVIFLPLRVKNVKWCWEVLLLTHDGRLRAFLISKTDGCELHHTFTFPGAVSAAAYNDTHQQIYVAGIPNTGLKDPSSPISAGLTAWRILNEEPFYKLSVVSDQNEAQLATKSIKIKIPFVDSKNLAYIVSMSVSNDGTKLLCIHSNGTISTWNLPTLRQLSCWPLSSQPQYDAPNTLLGAQSSLVPSQPAHHAWWGDQEVIISRFSGSVTICHVDHMVNILGKKPEFLHGVPRVTRRVDGTFIALECETTVLPAKKKHNDDSMEMVQDEPEKESFLSITKELVKTILYAVTDLETFQPKPKKITVVSKIYRLLGFRSTTPLELISRKIANGQYEEALSVADEYGMDKDLVYQEQWRKANVTLDTIQKYLGKVSKKIWVVHQCVDRLPETVGAAEELLNFGLQLTNKEILDEINRDRSEEDMFSDPHKITPDHLNSYTTELLRCRHSMLFYKHRLKLYKEILQTEKSNYVKDEYQCLRSTNAIKCAIELAKEGRVSALTCIWPLLESSQVRRLALDTLPETINPMLYRHLLPKPVEDSACNTADPKTDDDWCQNDIFRNLVCTDEKSAALEELNVPAINADIKTWYEKRARDIEMFSGQVSNALCLLRLALGLGIDVGLIHFYMETLDTLVYETDREDLTLDQVENMSVMEVALALMKKSITQIIPEHVNTILIPYLKNYDKVMQNSSGYALLLQQFMETISDQHLNFTTAVMRTVTLDITALERVTIIDRCVCAHKGTTQLGLIQELIECLPLKVPHNDKSITLEILEKYRKDLTVLLETVTILQELDTPTSTYEIASLRKDKDVSRIHLLYSKVARHFANRPLDADEIASTLKFRFSWLIKHLIHVENNAFPGLVDVGTINEILAQALLSSGEPRMLSLSREVMKISPEDPNEGHLVPYERACSLVLFAAREYFNSAGDCVNDKNIHLAKQCLKLIQPPIPEISTELDLIAALPIIHSFGVQILPMHVRLCKDRLKLIAMCLEADPKACNATPKLIKLATLLKIFEQDERQREAEVLMLACRRALETGPTALSACAAAARRLCALRYAPATHLLRDVALSPAAAPLSEFARRSLLAAAAAHPSARLPELLAERINLENEVLQRELNQKMSFSVLPDEESSDDDVSSSEEDSDFCEEGYKESLATNLLKAWNKNIENQPRGTQPESGRVHIQEFYRSLHPSLAVSTQHYEYTSFATVPITLAAQPACALLHHYYLQPPPGNDLETSVLLNAFNELVSSDTPLGVMCALSALYDVNKYSEAVLSQDSITAVCALLYAVLIKTCQPDLKDDVYLASPIKLARLALKNQTAAPEHLWLIRLCLSKIENITEIQRMEAVGIIVDRHQYSTDPTYSKEVILKMAQSGSSEQSDLAMVMAMRRGINPLDLRASRAAAAVLANVEPAQILQDLKLQPGQEADAVQLVTQAVWDEIAGHEHNELITLYSLVSLIDDGAVLNGMLASQHVKLLKKIKAAMPGLNYNMLLNPASPEHLTQHLLTLMRMDRLGMVMKLLRTMPEAIKVPVPPDVLLMNFLIWNFFTKAQGTDEMRWINQFDELVDQFRRLSPQQMLDIVAQLCFSKQALERIMPATRLQMIVMAHEWCQKQVEAGEEDKEGMKWGEAGDRVLAWATFLEALWSARVRNALEAINLPQLWGMLESSRGETENVQPLLCRLVMETDLRPDNLTDLIANLKLDISMEDVFTYILDTYVDSPIRMRRVVCQLRTYGVGGTELLQRTLDLAEEYQLPANVITVVQSLILFEKVKEGGGLNAVLEYTISLLRAEWSYTDFTDVTVESLQSPEQRRALFGTLMCEANTWSRRHALAEAVGYWPHTPSDTNEESPGLQFVLLRNTLSRDHDHEHDDQAQAQHMLHNLLRHPHLSHAEIMELEEVAGEGEVSATLLWVMLKSNCDTVYQYIPQFLQKINWDNLTINTDLIRDLLDRGLLMATVGTSLYPFVVRFVLGGHSAEHDARWAAAELVAAGCRAEAAHLCVLVDRVPDGLRTFSQALLYANKT